MSDQPENILLVYLRRIDEKLDRIADDVRELKVRATALEQQYASLSRRLDMIDDRLSRVERRLDLTDAVH